MGESMSVLLTLLVLFVCAVLGTEYIVLPVIKGFIASFDAHPFATVCLLGLAVFVDTTIARAKRAKRKEGPNVHCS